MRIVNMDAASILATGTGSVLVTDAEVRAAEGAVSVFVNPSVAISIVDGKVGTVANSPVSCPAGVFTEIAHRAGTLFALSSSGTATVLRAIGCEP